MHAYTITLPYSVVSSSSLSLHTSLVILSTQLTPPPSPPPPAQSPASGTWTEWQCCSALSHCMMHTHC